MAKLGLCIGINDYPGTGSDLSGCVNDANDWAAALRRRGFTVASLLDGKATGANVRNAIHMLVAGAAAGDVVAIQFSGHGSFVPDVDGDEPDGTDECLCPHDIGTNGPITDDELFQLFSLANPDARVILISDSCHSGTVSRFSPISTPPTMRVANPPQRKVRFLPPATFLSPGPLADLGLKRDTRSASPPGRYGALLMAGCQDSEYSYDAWFDGRPNGAFTFVALRALAGLPSGATYADWHRAIGLTLPSQQYPQNPNLYGSSAMAAWPVLV